MGPHWLAAFAGFLVAGVLLFAVWRYTQSAERSEVMTPGDALNLRRLFTTHGSQDSLGYFSSRRDKSVIFFPDGHATVSYRVIGSVCHASGAPLGAPRGIWPTAIAA